MNSLILFFQRLKEEWKFQYKVFSSVFDWTVIVYIVLPGLVAFGFIYHSWWTETPEWISKTPLFIVFFLTYLLAWTGNYRTFIQEADKVFLVKHYFLFTRLKQMSYVYSLLMRAVCFGLVLLFFLPFFYYSNKATFVQSLSFFLLFTSLNWFIMLIKLNLRKIYHKFARMLTYILVFILGSWLIQFIYLFWINGSHLIISMASAIFAGSALVFYYPHLFKRSTFDEDWIMEQQERNRYINIIFTAAPEIENTKIATRTKPWLFRNSKRLFKSRTAEKGFIEFFLKVFLRNSAYLVSFFQIISVTIFALIMIPPLWIKSLVFIGFVIMMYSWLLAVWNKVTVTHPLTKKYGEMHAFFSARKKVIFAFLMIAILLVSAGFSVNEFFFHSLL